MFAEFRHLTFRVELFVNLDKFLFGKFAIGTITLKRSRSQRGVDRSALLVTYQKIGVPCQYLFAIEAGPTC